MRAWPAPAVLMALLSFPHAGAAQQLHVRSSKIIGDLARFIVLPVRCDAGQNAYVWGAEPPAGSRLPIQELDSDGKELRQFDIAAAKRDGIEHAFVQSYAVTPDGWLYELVGVPKDKVAVVRFRPSGEYAGAVLLDRAFHTVHLAVFRTGELFVDGTTAAGKETYEPFMAIFDPMGRFLTEVKSGDPPVALSEPAAPKRSAKHAEDAHTQEGRFPRVRSPGSISVSPNLEAIWCTCSAEGKSRRYWLFPLPA